MSYVHVTSNKITTSTKIRRWVLKNRISLSYVKNPIDSTQQKGASKMLGKSLTIKTKLIRSPKSACLMYVKNLHALCMLMELLIKLQGS
jgi:hypothetical protein